MIIFNQIETVLLDMDGTILDKYYDDYFWEILVPKKICRKECYILRRSSENFVLNV
jgi:putative hydrolase of the HAD superfamily